MVLDKQTTPPDSRTSYVLRQLEGERLTIPGSKGVFRILASSKQTNGGIAVFTSGATLSDAPGFHWHQEAHDVFLVTKGFLKLWNGDKCRIMGPGDFAYVPPKVIHNPELLGPHTETLGLVAPGDWIDFFRYVAESYGGVLVPESDDRNLKALLIPKVMAAKDRFDVHFERDYQPPEVADWLPTENQIPEAPLTPYFLKADTGPRWLAGGVLSRPYITAAHTQNKFAISSIESSAEYKTTFLDGKRFLTFAEVDHCFFVVEGSLSVTLQGQDGATTLTAGETLVVSAGQAFALGFASRYVKALSFTNGPGIEALIQAAAGSQFAGFVIPDELPAWELSAFETAATSVGAKIE